MKFSRQEYWSGLPFPLPEDLPNPEVEPGSPALQADSLSSETPKESLTGVGENSNEMMLQNAYYRAWHMMSE